MRRPAPEPEKAQTRRRILASILLASCALKLALLAPAHATEPVRDASDYLIAARAIHETGSYDTLRPPLYPVTLAAARWLAALRGREALTGPWNPWGQRIAREPEPFGTDLDVARLLQVLMSTFCVGLIYLLGRDLFDARAGLVAAGLFAFYPDFVGYSHLLWAETQLVTLNAAWLLLLLRGARGGRPALLFAGGVVLGLAALTRPVVLAVSPAVLAWLFAMRPRPLRVPAKRVAAVALGAALAIAPWTLRNAIVHGAFVPVSPQAGPALLFGASEHFFLDLEVAGLKGEVSKDVAWSRQAGERALEIILADPARYLRHIVSVNLPGFWAPGSTVVEYLQWPWGYELVPGWLARTVIALLVGSYLVVLGLGAIGAALAPNLRETLLPVFLVAQTTLVHTVIGGFHRHRLFLVMLFLLYTGFLLSRGPAALRRLLTARRAAAAAAAAGILLGLALLPPTNPVLVEAWWFFDTRKDLRGRDLRESDLRRADLERADLRSAVLRNADLRGADLRGAILQEADLRGARLTLARLDGALLYEADLREVRGLGCGRLRQTRYWRGTRRDESLHCVARREEEPGDRETGPEAP